MSLRSFAEDLYVHRLIRQLTHVPTHVAIIQDGNRRYAKAKGKDTAFGHRAGAEITMKVFDWMEELGVIHTTFYAFSTENFKRSPEEVNELLELFIEKFSEMIKDQRIYDKKVNITVIGDRSLINDRLLQKIHDVEEATKDHHHYYLHFAIAYGGRNEILETTKSIVAKVRAGEFSADSITPDCVTERMYPEVEMPPVDLIIRTANDKRTSNFLPWLANGNEAAVCFCVPPWPEFRYVDMVRALRTYDQRMKV
ncbi:polyprenyl diphosphate synthase [uncultured Methanocorpusculum sp.]|nr:polyprenyl diphosphate synthase [uncultured Methanocorpusculum sp.]